jgi:hypothetical protein
MSTRAWGTDTLISMPVPLQPDQEVLADFGGFCFTPQGLAHNLSMADLDAILIPTYLPTPPPEG